MAGIARGRTRRGAGAAKRGVAAGIGNAAEASRTLPGQTSRRAALDRRGLLLSARWHREACGEVRPNRGRDLQNASADPAIASGLHRERGERSRVMKITFPSREFDEAVAAVCHGSFSDEQASALNELLRSAAAARDEYLLRLELHSRLASEPDLFPQTNEDKAASPENVLPIQTPRRARTRKANWILALAACVALLAAGWWALRFSHSSERK